jgi:hypothetical protein
MRRRSAPLLALGILIAALLAFLYFESPGRKAAGKPEPPPARKPAIAAKPAPEAGKKPEPAIPPAKPERVAPKPQPRGGKPGEALAAIIIDDLGYNLDAVEKLGALGRPVTVSVLPFAPLTAETVRLAAAFGLEVMLHLPLEPHPTKDERMEVEGTIRAGVPAAEVRADVIRCLERVPGARGVNNHAGSSVTESAAEMAPILDVLKERGLYFIDSRTTKETVAYEEALQKGVKAAFRQVFIDAEAAEDAVHLRLEELFRLARKHGRAVGIAHARRDTLAFLARHIGLADEWGVRLVFASEIVD